MMKRLSLAILSSLILLSGLIVFEPRTAEACSCCGPRISCAKRSQEESQKTIEHISEEFFKHRKWMIEEFWEIHLLPGLMLMTEQLTAAAMFQVQVIGTFFDAKHQLETQRLFQELSAQAHKDYQPSEGMCTIGTNVRSLAASSRNAEFTAEVIAKRGRARQVLNGDGISSEDNFSDRQSRFAQFLELFCNPKDNARGLDLLCGSGTPKKTANRDIDFTMSFDAPLTLEIDFSKSAASDDEKSLFALASNLYGHQVPPLIDKNHLSIDSSTGEISRGAQYLQDLRAIAAKRSVAQNSFASIAAQKAQGEAEVQPYLYKLLEEMGVPKKDAETILGTRPSYYAQMEVLTKKLYQDPNFYTDLYDKPANVKRKEVAMQAIDLMQKRDIFRSLLRAESNLSVMLELLVAEEQRIVDGEINPGSRR